MKTMNFAVAACIALMLRFPILTLASMPLMSVGQTKGRASSLEEARVAAKAFRQMSSKVDSGLDYREYSRSVSELKFAVDELYAELARRRNSSEAAALRLAFEPYQDAKDLWSECVASRDCQYGVVPLDTELFPTAVLVLELLKRYPSLDRSVDDGGAKDSTTGNVRWRVLLGRLWAIGGDRARGLNLPR